MASKQRHEVSLQDFRGNSSALFDEVLRGSEVLVSLQGIEGQYLSYPYITHAKLRSFKPDDKITSDAYRSIGAFNIACQDPVTSNTATLLDVRRGHTLRILPASHLRNVTGFTIMPHIRLSSYDLLAEASRMWEESPFNTADFPELP